MLALIAILAVQLLVAALLFGTLLLDRSEADVRAADGRRQRR